MKVLYFGGQKSGKSRLAEQKALELAKNQAVYVATYDNSYGDAAMQVRLKRHQQQRSSRFVTVEEAYDLTGVVQPGKTYLVDCLSMLILNNMSKDKNFVKQQLEIICALECNLVFVLNDVGSGVIPLGKTSREYVDRSGETGQFIASLCDLVYEVKLGLQVRLK